MNLFPAPQVRLFWALAASLFLGCFSAEPMCAAEAVKTKVLEKFETIDKKTLNLNQAEGKIVSTTDKDHPKVLEIKMKYAVLGAQYGGIGKSFHEATLNPGKYEAFRFWVRSDVGTSFSVGIGGGYKRKDGKASSFGAPGFTAEPEWKQITVPFSSFKRSAARWYKDKKWHVQPGGGEPLDDEDYGGITSIGFVSTVNSRGTSVIGQAMFDNLELVEKQQK